jgi:hypothetical protein
MITLSDSGQKCKGKTIDIEIKIGKIKFICVKYVFSRMLYDDIGGNICKRRYYQSSSA